MSLDLDVAVTYLPKLLDGARLTVQLVVFSGLIGLILAVPLGIARSSERLWVKGGPWAYIFFFRGTPLMVQLFLVYYGLSQFPAVRHSALWPFLRDPYWCALLTMALHTAAYIAEILRGAIQAVPRGEVEAGVALGMKHGVILRRIVLPRAVRIALPAYSNEVILMLKGSALASTITLLELTGMARTIIAKTYMPVEIFLAAGAFYLAISYVIVRLFKLLEWHLARHLRHRG
ncbi:ABC transporter permease [Magnetospirillum aberrantis]|uniref:ABC transporter permease n=1 Tax=Magnetospirillum aberrantis SpK TaxID=908842 RepID=A0A7C9USC0_9PROT|nr:ABC transporter permease [Magnetospirillum aberrantis]NFV79208.1 ABC transporter permease [Magnetospirillum aberrantis SpK]